MTFRGYCKTFSTRNGAQYDHIGRFWDFLAAQCGRESLRGLGFNWTEDTLEYAIGLKSAGCDIRELTPFEDSVFIEVELPDNGWEHFSGESEHLSELYGVIYSAGALRYETEEFNDDGTCRVSIIREG